MKHFLMVFVLLGTPAVAEDSSADLLERGARMFLEGLLQEMEPALEDLQDLGERMTPALRGFLAEMGPALKDLMGEVEDWSAYHPPEILENGDIIIRRKLDVPKGDEIDL